MIYKFIDNNGAEITVNSLSSLEALIESETVKENTQVKAGLRGKWTAAINIDELKDLFNKKVEEIAEPESPEEDDIANVVYPANNHAKKNYNKFINV